MRTAYAAPRLGYEVSVARCVITESYSPLVGFSDRLRVFALVGSSCPISSAGPATWELALPYRHGRFTSSRVACTKAHNNL